MSNYLKYKYIVLEIFYTVLGSLIMAFATAQFLLPNHLSTGGFSGIATIVYYLLNIPIGTTNFVINIPLLILAYFKIGKYFIAKAIGGTVLLSLFLNILEELPALTEDRLLACIYGGILMGLGTSLIFKASASTGGTDLITTIVKKYNAEARTSNVVIIFDTIIVLLNVLFFRTIEVGLYSAIAIYLMGKMIDISFEGINFSKMIFIISDKFLEISNNINEDLGRGTTGLYGKGMYTNKERTILLCIANRSEVAKIRKIVDKVDKNAFIIISNAREVFGKGFKGENNSLEEMIVDKKLN